MKFRLYSHKHKLYTHDPFWPSNQRTFSEWLVSPDGEIIEMVGCPDGENNVWYAKEIHSSKNFTVEHFTGFYDKNAKRIHQGDVLVYMSDFIALKYQVIWKNNGFKLDNGKGVAIGFSQEDLKDYEVVGTIHG